MVWRIHAERVILVLVSEDLKNYIDFAKISLYQNIRGWPQQTKKHDTYSMR